MTSESFYRSMTKAIDQAMRTAVTTVRAEGKVTEIAQAIDAANAELRRFSNRHGVCRLSLEVHEGKALLTLRYPKLEALPNFMVLASVDVAFEDGKLTKHRNLLESDYKRY